MYTIVELTQLFFRNPLQNPYFLPLFYQCKLYDIVALFWVSNLALYPAIQA